MKAQGVLIGVLVGVVVALASMLLLTHLPTSTAEAQGGGGGGGAGNTIAIATEVIPGQSVLYVIDTQAKAILCYGFYLGSKSTSVGAIRNCALDLVTGRTYKYDSMIVDKLGYFGNTDTEPAKIKKELEKRN